MNIDNETLYRIRWVYGFSCATMGDLLECSAMLVSYIERGERSLTTELRRRVISEFDLTPEKLARILAIYGEFNDRAQIRIKHIGLRPTFAT